MPNLTRGPDPHVKKPKLIAPKGACDSHIHLFGPASKYPFASDSPYTAHDALPEDFFKLQDKLGLATGVIVSPGGYGRNSAMLSDALAKHPDRFRGVALMADDAPASEFARLGKLGVKGMRMMSAKRGQHVPNYAVQPAKLGADHGWHVQFYPHGADITEFADQLLALPNTITLDHFASVKAENGLDQPGFKTLLRMLDTGRVWIKLSGPMRCVPGDFPYAAVTPMARALVAHRPDRLVFGTDWPHVNMDGRNVPNDGDLVDLIPEWIGDEKTQRKILVDNPRKLYGFPAA